MHLRNLIAPILFTTFGLVACGGSGSGEDNASSTPIDSTNQNGTAPAVYGAENPANVQDTNFQNSSDTGTRRSNGPDNTNDLNSPNNNTQNR